MAGRTQGDVRGMKRNLISVGLVVGAVLLAGVLGAPAWAQDDPTCKVEFLVVRDSNGKAVRDASVVLHPVNKSGKQARGGFELKTDNDGKTEFEGVPYGKMRIQVLAPGFQTYGDDYVIDKPSMDITIKLKRPAQQYSVYSDQNGTPKDAAPKQ